MKKIILAFSFVFVFFLPAFADEIMNKSSLKQYLTRENLTSKPKQPTSWLKQKDNIGLAVGADGIRILKFKPFTLFYSIKMFDERVKNKMQQEIPNMEYSIITYSVECTQNKRYSLSAAVYDKNDKVIFGGKYQHPEISEMNSFDMAICEMVIEGLWENETNK